MSWHDVRESDIRDAIFEYLMKKKHPLVIRDKQYPSMQIKLFPESAGVSDIWGIPKTEIYRMFAIEVKKPKAKTNPKREEAQQKFLDTINHAGGIGFRANCLQDVIDRGL